MLNRYYGVPIPMLIVVLLAIVFVFIAVKTPFGRYIYAIGGNIEAAALSGINIKRVVLAVFILMGALSAVAGIILTSRLNAATVSAGEMYELDAIAACVIGGTSLMGGRGNIVGGIIGALIMCSFDMLFQNEYEVIGTKGKIVVSRAYRPDVDGGEGRITVATADGNVREETVAGDQYALQIEHFSRSILEGTPLLYSPERMIKLARALDACRTSMKTEEIVQL